MVAETQPLAATVLNELTNPGPIHLPAPADLYYLIDTWPHWGNNE